MRRFLLGFFICLLTLGVLVGGGLLLADKESPTEPVPQVTEAAVPAESFGETLPALPETVPTVPETQPVLRQSIDAVPRYYQTDYPHINFGNGTIATSGCSVTCLAMIATYMTDIEYTPVQMAYHFGSYGKNNISRLDYGLSEMHLPYERVSDVQLVLKRVKEGKVAIVMMDDESVFTTQQHFIVIAGMTEDGKYIVNDPYETTYLQADTYLKNAYENGFEDFNLMRGFSGGWIFDKAAMPEDYEPYDASMPEQQANRYEGYTLTGEDIYTLACFAWAEARNESPEVQQAVVEVVLNRLISEDYPNTVEGILKKTELYRAWSAMSRLSEPELAQYIAVDAAMYGPYILPEDICFYSAWEKGEEIWGQLGSFTFAKKR